jgi:hypothetical protein
MGLVIKKIASICQWGSFFIIFLMGIDFVDIFNPFNALGAFAKGTCGAILFWFAGYIIGDIVVKGIVHEIPEDDPEYIDGGLLQRFQDAKTKETVNLTTQEEKQ